MLNPKKLAAVLISTLVIAPLAGCHRLTPEEQAAATARDERVSRELFSELGLDTPSPDALKSVCVKFTEGQLAYITERFNTESLAVLTETLALNPTVKCEKVGHVINMLPRVQEHLNDTRRATEKSAILHTAFAG